MKRIIIISLIITGTYLCREGICQNIPNAGFENWNTIELFESPNNWVSGNAESIFQGSGFEVLTTEKTEDSYSGEYALHLKSIDIDPSASTEIVFGYAISNAYIDFNNDIPAYYGGNPVTGNPDSICGYFKYSLPSTDTAFIIFAGKRNGEIVVQDFFKIFGEQDTYTRLKFDLSTDTLTSPIDTVIILITCSHISDNYAATVAGASLTVDSLWFTGINDTIPNGNFENWRMLNYEDPENWWTTNAYHSVFNDTNMIATRSTESHSGDYALRLESRYVNGTNVILSYASTAFGVFQSEPVIDIDFNPSMLGGYYKYDSPVSDEAVIVAVIFGETINHGYYEDDFVTVLPETAEYTHFELPITIPSNITANGAAIHIMPGDVIFTSDSFEPGSVLFIDDLEFVNPCESLELIDIFEEDVITICDGATTILDAGEGYPDYSWSTEETTRTIGVTTAGTYSVTITDGSCQLSDEIEVITVICESISKVTYQELYIYPNPTNGNLTIELPLLTDQNIQVQIFDVLGHKLYEEPIKINDKNKNLNLNLSQLNTELYTILIEGDNTFYIGRLLKE